MSILIVDASVAAKWVLPRANETLVDEAFDLLRRYTDGQFRFYVPDLFWVELSNILWKAVRLRRWTRSGAEVALSAMKARKLLTAPSLPLLEEACAIALTFDRTVYDSVYVALALRSKAQLVTADERMALALAAYLPVKWLGSL